jgi:hypothetical protein
MSALERLGRHGTFKSRALWSVKVGKGLKNEVCLLSPTYKSDLECDLQFHNMITNEP